MGGVWPNWALMIIGKFLMAAGNLGRQTTLRSILGPDPTHAQDVGALLKE